MGADDRSGGGQTKSASKDLLVQEVKETNAHHRTMFQIMVAWFTFFCTMLVAVMRWTLVDESGHGQVVGTSVFLLTEIILGMFACAFFIRSLARARERIDEIVATVADAEPACAIARPSPAIPAFYTQAGWLMLMTMVTNFVVWVLILTTAVARALVVWSSS